MSPTFKVTIVSALLALVSCQDWESRIYNGIAAGTFIKDSSGAILIENNGEYPYLASLQRSSDGFHLCGTCIVTDNVLITAAHCVNGSSPADFRIVAGSVMVGNRSTWNPSYQEREISSIVVHPQYNVTSKFVADIAVITLSQPLNFNQYVNKIKVVDASEQGSFLGEQVRIMGWGLTEQLLNSLNVLYADVYVIENNVCSKVREFPVVDSMICVAEQTGMKGACLGDSGGPLVHMASNDPQTHILLGVTSNVQVTKILNHGINVTTCITNVGSIYTDVAAFRPWIDQYVEL